MEGDFRRARYELVTTHALALGGVLAAEIYLSDEPDGPLRLIARSRAPSPDAPIVGDVSHQHLDRDTEPSPDVSYPPGFFEAVLEKSRLHEAAVAWADAGGARDGSWLARTSVLHLMAARLEPRRQARGLMLFVLDHAPREPEKVAFLDFVAEARTISELELAGQLEPSLQNSYRLEAVLELARTTLLGGDLSAILQALIIRLRDLFNADLAAILLLDQADGTIKLAAAASSEQGGKMLRERAQGSQPRETGITGWVARNMRPALIPDTEADSRPEVRPRMVAESMVAAPFARDGKLIGVLRLGAIGRNRFGPADLRLIEAVASQVAVVVEVTRLRDEMRQQNESLATMARLVEASRDAILLIDPAGRMEHCNPAMERLFGYPKDVLIGQSIRSLMPARDALTIDHALRTALHEGGDWQREVELIHSDGSQFPGELQGSGVFDEEGKRVGWVTIIRDLTRRKMWEQQLVQTEKLRSLGVMAAGVAHEVNNTLATVLGQAELLAQLTADPTARRYLETIILAAEDGAGAVKRITEFSRPSSDSEFAPVDLAGVVGDVLRATSRRWEDQAAREGRAIDATATAPHPVWVSGSVTELREALTNMVLNAVDAMPNGGRIDIDVRAEGERALLTVSDTGTGMPREVLERVFDPFFTTKPFGVGTGLGLALTYGIVERHHGTVQVSSQPGQGTTFAIELPLAEAPLPVEETKSDASTTALRILVVDDEQVLGEQLRTILSLDGHSIRLCTSGQDALAALDQPYDLVITDLAMPGVDGWEVARAAKARFPDIRVGLVTGWTNDVADTGDLETRGIDFVVSKPYRIQTIRDAVARVCAPAVAVAAP